MANEAVIITLLGNAGDPVRYTVANDLAIEKGALLRMYSDNTVSGSQGIFNVAVGIAAAEKVANDGSTDIPVYTNGIFDIKFGAGTCKAGDLVVISGTNLIERAKDVITQSYVYNSGMVLGVALEDAAASEVIAVKVRV